MVRISKERCIGCGICEEICPQGFKVEKGQAQIIYERATCLEEAASACPKGAILLDGDRGTNRGQEGVQKVEKGRGAGQRSGQGRGSGRGGGRGRGRGPGRRGR